jgi:hypothetical protein
MWHVMERLTVEVTETKRSKFNMYLLCNFFTFYNIGFVSLNLNEPTRSESDYPVRATYVIIRPEPFFS